MSSLWIFWHVLDNSFSFGYWGPCEPDPSFETSALPIYLDCFKLLWIDFVSIWTWGHYLNSFPFYLDFLTFSQFISFLFSYWGILGAPLANQTSLFNKADHLSIWIAFKCCELISFLFGLWTIILNDFFSNWIFIHILNWFIFFLDFLHLLSLFLFQLATGASLGHPLRARHLFWKSGL